MNEKPQTAVNYHIEKITKKYIIDYLNTLLFANTVLWDGVDQFHELPILHATNEDGYRTEQRGGLFVDRKTSRALRMSVVATESTVQGVCYRCVGLKEACRVDEGNKIYYPLDGIVIDVSIADLSLGAKDPSSYSFCDNTNENGDITNARLFALLRHILGSAFLAITNEELFKDLINEALSTPPLVSDPHYKPVFGVKDVPDSYRD